jgi:threonine dehydrogenase-like Zn-dependent dehydrogenase
VPCRGCYAWAEARTYAVRCRGSRRRFLPELIDLIWRREIDPGKVFDLELPLEEAAEGYRAMDERRAIKVLMRTRRSTASRAEG